MSSIRIGAQVECSDGPAGELVVLVIDPQKRTVTHYVVRTKAHDIERMVPSELVSSSTPTKLVLSCTLAELDQQQPFMKDDLISEQVIDPHEIGFSAAYGYGYGYGIPDVVPPDVQYTHIQSEQVPHGEVALHEGTPVRATDGQVGTVSTVVTGSGGVITHFVVDEGHFGRKSQLTLPLSVIDYSDDEGVHLKLNKEAIHALPTMPGKPGGGPLGPGYQRLELLAKVFDGTDEAQKALDYVRELEHQAGRPIHVREAAVLVRDSEGKARIQQSSQPGAGTGAAIGAVTGGLFALLGPLGLVASAAVGGAPGAIAGSKLDLGFPDAFLKRLEDKLQPGHSALVLLVEHDQAQDLADSITKYENVMGGQQLVDTLVQELLVERQPGEDKPGSA
ncbi:MAG TPA: DUF1269 domain-containing protein [Chloroflexota bacterium]|nr:DUF1269 domain-containing protein [Chloroflexota bacterium]